MAVDTLEPVEARLRETLRLAASQTETAIDLHDDDSLPVVVSLADHRQPRARRRTGWWLSAAASILAIALVVTTQIRGAHEQVLQSSSTTAAPVPALRPPRLVASYLPPGYTAQPITADPELAGNDVGLHSGPSIPAPEHAIAMSVGQPGPVDATFSTPHLAYPPTAEALQAAGIDDSATASVWADVNGNAARFAHDDKSISYTWTQPDGVRMRATYPYVGMKPDEIGSTFPAFNRANEELLSAARSAMTRQPMPNVAVTNEAPPVVWITYLTRPKAGGWTQRFSGPDGNEIRLSAIDRPFFDIAPPPPGATKFVNEDGFRFVTAPTMNVTGGRDEFTVTVEGDVSHDELVTVARGLRRAGPSDPAPAIEVATTTTAPPSTVLVPSTTPAPTTAVPVPPTSAAPITTSTWVTPTTVAPGGPFPLPPTTTSPPRTPGPPTTVAYPTTTTPVRVPAPSTPTTP